MHIFFLLSTCISAARSLPLKNTLFLFLFGFFCTPNSIHIQTGIVLLLLFLYLGYIFFVYFLLYFLSIFSFSFLFYILPITHCFFYILSILLHMYITLFYFFFTLLFCIYSLCCIFCNIYFRGRYKRRKI